MRSLSAADILLINERADGLDAVLIVGQPPVLQGLLHNVAPLHAGSLRKQIVDLITQRGQLGLQIGIVRTHRGSVEDDQVGEDGPVFHLEIAVFQELIQVELLGLIDLIRADQPQVIGFLPTQRHRGQIAQTAIAKFILAEIHVTGHFFVLV